MQTKHNTRKIGKLVAAWKAKSLLANEEYQRGAKWTDPQKQSLIDSIFREYPLPQIFLHVITSPGLDDESTKRYEVVDGQQRIRAMTDFMQDKFPTLETTNRKLRLPQSLRKQPAPWANLLYSQLPDTLKEQFAESLISVIEIQDTSHPDEVRDLFIRLQQGTALSRQQIRDAWPGSIGPHIEKLAGKLNKIPSEKLFGLLDKRGQRSDEDRDEYAVDRQFCAQLLCLFLARENDPCAVQGISAGDLDQLYHDKTEFDTSGPSAKRFQSLLGMATDVVEKAQQRSQGSKKKYRRIEIVSLFMFLQDKTRDGKTKLTDNDRDALATHLYQGNSSVGPGATVTGTKINEQYNRFRSNILESIGVKLDDKRLFDENDKEQIYKSQNGICAICDEEVDEPDAEYDHFPTPHASGGRTIPTNGRLVHRKCHARGPAAGKVRRIP